MRARRVSLVVFVAELMLLALPGTVLYCVSVLSLPTLLNDFNTVFDGAGVASGGGAHVTPLLILGGYALTFTSFWLLAWRFVAGGGERVRRVSVFVWTLALLGQAIALGSAVATAFVDSIPVLAVAALTYPALGLAVPLAHMFVAAWRASRDGAPADASQQTA